MKNRYCIVFDYETDGLDLQTLNITQIGAIPIDLNTLEVIEDRAFNLDVKPPDINSSGYLESHQETLDWHAKQQECSTEDVLNRWRDGWEIRDALSAFCEYLDEFKSPISPIAGGQNIIKFDLPITKRYINELNIKKFPFSRSNELDLLFIQPLWFMFSNNPPRDNRMDTLRYYFGIPVKGGHDAMKDVIDTAEIITRFLKVHKKLIPHVKTLYDGPVDEKEI